MVDYPDDARLTTGELGAWTENTADEIRRLEREGVIRRGPDGLFPLLPTIRAMADCREAELAWFKAHYRLSLKGWAMLIWGAPARGLSRLRHRFEYGAGRLLNWLWPVG
jgi:hypothetical protein